ncbi:UvrD-helicase domain-containing protein [Paenibacillus sp. J5C_2022]|uniref:RNA polymerase recycling motor HelD n=1 Tax=Paenibacillus sp. J5C2022 TaxID=2977129 RepID=UPI0021D07C13|nr:RNA polymerase recycling motor HelD [Paenibacillus sp. J5C2022]MCU6707699.1 UvrD-helicase domain-containing protein [Paenibacillus sp. J5C2022]
MSIIDKPDGLQQEQRRVEELRRLMKQRMAMLELQTGGLRDEIVTIRRHFWDDVTVNFEDAAETAETYASMKQQAELLSERERSHRVAAAQLKTLIRLMDSPYFGRIDIIEEGEDPAAAEPVYLGVGSLLDESGENYLVYDWRAPVSSVYYDYGPGPIRYTTPAGTIQGEMTLKRQYVIRDGTIRSMFDTGVTIGDELLQEVLGKHSDAAMKSIVATIQREQNQIIRNERARLLIVQGAAGSGKTSAALQRVAYLLYRYRDTLSAEQILLFSPNPMFNSYIATVLPELGEQNMGQTTYQQYLEHRLGGAFRLEDQYDSMEYKLTAERDRKYDQRMAGMAYKSDITFMHIIDAYAEELKVQGLRFRPLKFRGRVLIGEEAMRERFYGMDSGISIPNRLRMLSEWLLKELTGLGKLERKRSWVEDEMELLDNDEYIQAFQELRGKNKFHEASFDDADSERDYLAARIVQRKFKPLRMRVKRLKFIDVPAMYKGLFNRSHGGAELPEQWDSIAQWTLARLDEGMMPYEDATPYLYFLEKLEGFHTNTKIKHVLIDEAQDYSLFQFHYLKRLFPGAKMTVLGDSNQTIFAHASSGEGFHRLSGLFGEEHTETITLTRSYRSTQEIIQFTAGMLPAGHRIEPFNRSGKEPVVTGVSDEAANTDALRHKLAELERSGYRSVAVICKSAEESRDVYDRMKQSCPQLRLIGSDTATFEQGQVVIPSYLAKGVEFDAVVISDASSRQYSAESERKLFYTACTRAMHELHILYRGELTPFIQRG